MKISNFESAFADFRLFWGAIFRRCGAPGLTLYLRADIKNY